MTCFKAKEVGWCSYGVQAEKVAPAAPTHKPWPLRGKFQVAGAASHCTHRTARRPSRAEVRLRVHPGPATIDDAFAKAGRGAIHCRNVPDRLSGCAQWQGEGEQQGCSRWRESDSHEGRRGKNCGIFEFKPKPTTDETTNDSKLTARYVATMGGKSPRASGWWSPVTPP